MSTEHIEQLRNKDILGEEDFEKKDRKFLEDNLYIAILSRSNPNFIKDAMKADSSIKVKELFRDNKIERDDKVIFEGFNHLNTKVSVKVRMEHVIGTLTQLVALTNTTSLYYRSLPKKKGLYLTRKGERYVFVESNEKLDENDNLKITDTVLNAVKSNLISQMKSASNLVVDILSKKSSSAGRTYNENYIKPYMGNGRFFKATLERIIERYNSIGKSDRNKHWRNYVKNQWFSYKKKIGRSSEKVAPFFEGLIKKVIAMQTKETKRMKKDKVDTEEEIDVDYIPMSLIKDSESGISSAFQQQPISVSKFRNTLIELFAEEKTRVKAVYACRKMAEYLGCNQYFANYDIILSLEKKSNLEDFIAGLKAPSTSELVDSLFNSNGDLCYCSNRLIISLFKALSDEATNDAAEKSSRKKLPKDLEKILLSENKAIKSIMTDDSETSPYIKGEGFIQRFVMSMYSIVRKDDNKEHKIYEEQDKELHSDADLVERIKENTCRVQYVVGVLSENLGITNHVVDEDAEEEHRKRMERISRASRASENTRESIRRSSAASRRSAASERSSGAGSRSASPARTGSPTRRR